MPRHADVPFPSGAVARTRAIVVVVVESRHLTPRHAAMSTPAPISYTAVTRTRAVVANRRRSDRTPPSLSQLVTTSPAPSVPVPDDPLDEAEPGILIQPLPRALVRLAQTQLHAGVGDGGQFLLARQPPTPQSRTVIHR